MTNVLNKKHCYYWTMHVVKLLFGEHSTKCINKDSLILT